MIVFQNLYIAYQNKTILTNIDLTIRDSEFFVLIGSSGCGKTTLLKSINKLNPIKSGSLTINKRSVTSIRAGELPNLIGYVVQNGGLFPHLSIEENIALTLEIAKYPKERIDARIDEMMHLVNLEPQVYRNRYPSQLSGGQQQRVGIARAFAADPPIVLMDEPFSALDPVTRTELQAEIHDLQRTTGKTIVFVTHDMDEAIKLADRICIIQNGRIAQCDIPENILKHPSNQYVQDFIGKNRLWANPEYIRAADIMRLRPLSINRGRTVLQALTIMRQYGIDSLLLTDEKNRLLGLVRIQALMDEKDSSKKVDSFCISDCTTVHQDTTLQKIISTIDYDSSGIIPVISDDRTVLGYLTKSSLLATMSRQFVPERAAEIK
ncbi:MAG: ABC transporter ATP-binding protein [Eubacteriales bacterium]|nr:ABC transporter ATP-binding protein [Eubacteriales bacterium]